MNPSQRPAAGGEAALAALFERHYGRVLGTAFRVTGNRQDAEDVLQTVFLRLSRSEAGAVAEPSAPYFHRAAVNAAIDLLRTRARAGAVPLDDPARGELADDRGPRPDQAARDGEFRRRLRQALATLSDKAARVFTLRYIEELPNKEIARMLDMSPTTVAVTLHRARHRLQSTMRDLARGETS